MINHLIKLADKLDQQCFYNEANIIDNLIITTAQEEVNYDQLISTLFGDLIQDAPKMLETPFTTLEQAESTRKQLYELFSYISNLITQAKSNLI